MAEINYFYYANLFPTKVVSPNIVKIKGHNFTGLYHSPIPIKPGARKCIILSCLSIKLKEKVVFLCFSDFDCCSKRMACN